MYEELVKRLNGSASVKYGARISVERELLQQAADVIEKLSKKREAACWGCKCEKIEQASWISVTERLPMIGEKAICFGKNGYMIGTYGEFGWMFPCYFGNVTHWMPLPEPPEEE